MVPSRGTRKVVAEIAQYELFYELVVFGPNCFMNWSCLFSIEEAIGSAIKVNAIEYRLEGVRCNSVDAKTTTAAICLSPRYKK